MGDMMQTGPSRIATGEWKFSVWAPFQEKISVIITSPDTGRIPLTRDDRGYWHGTARLGEKTRYYYELDGRDLYPDPASRYQPEGVFGPSEILSFPHITWTDKNWKGIDQKDMIIYEIHVGTFTREGTFDAVIPRLTELTELGITAVEIMPISQFPGDRNWGYDGAYPFAVQNSYGGPAGFARLVDACHAQGIAVILDVVYNHGGPEGCFLSKFGPYFSSKYHTPWGDALNFDDQYSDEVRHFFLDNARMWLEDYHVDALRLDAIHAIFDQSAKPFLSELSEQVAAISRDSGRKRFLLAESDLNDIRVLLPCETGGYGMDAQWCEDFHHCLHSLLTGEKTGFYQDFGSLIQMKKSLAEGFVYDWKYSKFRRKHFGSSSRGISPDKFIVFSQNHDMVGNQISGKRLSSQISYEALKLTAGVILLSPYLPLLFMGEEYGETAPFYYFISHHDQDLIEAVRSGRMKEHNIRKPDPKFSDPNDLNTYLDSRIHWEMRSETIHRTLLSWYKTLITLRKQYLIRDYDRYEHTHLLAEEKTGVLMMKRSFENETFFCIMNFSDDIQRPDIPPSLCAGRKILDSAELGWNGPGSELPSILEDGKVLNIRPKSIAVYHS